MEGRQRRSFTDDYKRQAVDLVASSGRSIGSVAKELGVRDSVLRRWVELRGAGREPTAAARRKLRRFPLCDDVPEIRYQLAVVTSEHLVQGPLGPRCLPSPFLALSDFVLVFLHFCFQVRQHGTTPHNIALLSTVS